MCQESGHVRVRAGGREGGGVEWKGGRDSGREMGREVSKRERMEEEVVVVLGGLEDGAGW